MAKRVSYSVLATIVVIILLTIVYLLTTQKQVTAPTLSESQKQDLANDTSPANNVENNEVFKNALNLYITKKAEGLDMSAGPCLGKIGEDWVLDIAHSPRTAADDKSENQCADFAEGRAHHFIELDPDGKLIRSL